jgi:hypothetical protein
VLLLVVGGLLLRQHEHRSDERAVLRDAEA